MIMIIDGHDLSRMTRDEMRPVFRDLAKKYHPDRNPDNPAALEIFHTLERAWRDAPLTRAVVRAGFRVRHGRQWWLVERVHRRAAHCARRTNHGDTVRATIPLTEIEDSRCGTGFRFRMFQVWDDREYHQRRNAAKRARLRSAILRGRAERRLQKQPTP